MPDRIRDYGFRVHLSKLSNLRHSQINALERTSKTLKNDCSIFELASPYKSKAASVDQSVTTMEIMELPQTNTTEPSSTDLLLSLPPELLLPIFSFVGVENFRRDVRRLAVCKKWYAYARPILLGELQLRSDDLLSMLRATRRGTRLTAAQQMTKHVNLKMVTEASCSKYPSAFHLERLASRLTEFAALRTLVIRSNFYSLYYTAMPRLRSRVFSSFVAIQQLTSLEIDIENLHLERDSTHLCESISQQIPNLKRLRCRLPRMCSGLLGSPPGDLEELIICIINTDAPSHGSQQCFTGLRIDADDPRTTLEARLVQFAASMRNPKIVRLVHGFRLHGACAFAFDAMKKRRFVLGYCPPWDADGKLLSEDWKEGDERELSDQGEEGTEIDDDYESSDYAEKCLLEDEYDDDDD